MATYKPIQSIVLGSNTSSVTFSNISQDYSDLVLVTQCGVSTTNYLQIQLNSDTTMTNYSATWMEGDGSAASSGRYSGATGGYNLGGATTNTTLENMSIVHFQNYSNSTTYKTWVVRNDRASRSANAAVGLWRNTAAITSILIKPFNGAYNLVSGSTFDLYGIKSGAPSALGGDLVTTDGTYWYHTFKTTQTFTTLKPLTVDYLVVAGGAGGGYVSGGGGGAGGLRSTVTATGGGGSLESALSLTASTSYTVTVGAGGAGAGGGVKGYNGSNSVFSTITSTGGGGGSSDSNRGGATGGSGGGGNGGSGAGSGTANQGYAGGSGAGDDAAGAGGGAGAVGGNGSGTTGGTGGTGVAVAISGSSVTYAGGGGGSGRNTRGAGGAGGGGQGGLGDQSSANAGSAGTANTGGGGGGSAGNAAGGSAGGSGIVIVRYPV